MLLCTKGPQWIISTSPPSTTAVSDLDGDGNCVIVAYMESEESAPPSGDWTLQCDGKWLSTKLAIADVGSATSVSHSLVSSAITLAAVASFAFLV